MHAKARSAGPRNRDALGLVAASPWARPLRAPKKKPRPVYGGARKFQDDPNWRDCLSFYEYFHGDNGAGLGANHQTGWTGIIARIIHLFAKPTPEMARGEKHQYFSATASPAAVASAAAK